MKKVIIAGSTGVLGKGVSLECLHHPEIEKYWNNYKAVAQGRLFPKISNQKLNSYLKEIADACGIKKNLNFHIARHTFATTVTLLNDVPIETVSKMLGHTKLSTTQKYARVIEKKISKDMRQLKMKSKKSQQYTKTEFEHLRIV